MKSIKGTKTEGNLLKAFAGESQARNRYTFFAETAKKEGYEQIAATFAETAEQEKEHAKIFFKLLAGGKAVISDATYPAGVISNTADNLLAAAEGEREEWDVLYPTFADVAEQEGFPDVAAAFRQITKVEIEHEQRYLKLLSRMTGGNFFSSRRRNLVAVPKLRFCLQGEGCAEDLSCLPTSASIFRAAQGELLERFR